MCSDFQDFHNVNSFCYRVGHTPNRLAIYLKKKPLNIMILSHVYGMKGVDIGKYEEQTDTWKYTNRPQVPFLSGYSPHAKFWSYRSVLIIVVILSRW